MVLLEEYYVNTVNAQVCCINASALLVSVFIAPNYKQVLWGKLKCLSAQNKENMCRTNDFQVVTQL